MLDALSSRFFNATALRDCCCGLRYLRHVIGDARPHTGVIVCHCGAALERWSGVFWLDYEPEERTGYLH